MKYRPSSRFREYVKKVMACGHWADGEQAIGGDKAVLIHSSTGKTIAYQLHDGGNDWNSARNFATEAGAICGCSFVENRNRRRSRKAPETTDFNIARAQREQASWHGEWGPQIDRAHERRDAATVRLREIKASPSTHATQNEAKKLIGQILAAEQVLCDYHQPFTPFSPADLEESA